MTQNKSRFKICARNGRGDGWQSFTGSKLSTVDKIEEHIKKNFRSLPYEFGIFISTTKFSIKYKRDMQCWVLYSIYDLRVSENSIPRSKGDMKMAKVAVELQVDIPAPERIKSFRKLQSIRRTLRINKCKKDKENVCYQVGLVQT